MRSVETWRLFAITASAASLVVLAACGGDGNGPEAGSSERSVAPAPSEMAAMMTAETTPADAVRSLLAPGYVFPPDGGGVLEAPDEGAHATYAPILRADGGQSGYYALLTRDDKILVLDDPSRAPEDGFVFIPYYKNSGGTGTVLTLGYFQLADGVLIPHGSVFVEDRADWEALDYQGDSQFVIKALTHGPDQAMADAPDVPLNVAFVRKGDTLVNVGRSEDVVNAGGGVLWITPDGLGPITAESTYADLDLSGFLPGAEVMRTDEAMGEAGTYSILSFASGSGTVVVQYLLDGPLVSISSTDPGIGSALGIWPGDRMVDHWDGLNCSPGLEIFAAGMICSREGTPHLAVYFSGPMPDNVPDGWVPAADDPRAETWRAEQVLWLDNVDMARTY